MRASTRSETFAGGALIPSRSTSNDQEAAINLAGTDKLLTDRFAEALTYAARIHRTQTRKGKDVPYIAHLMAVCATGFEDKEPSGDACHRGLKRSTVSALASGSLIAGTVGRVLFNVGTYSRRTRESPLQDVLNCSAVIAWDALNDAGFSFNTCPATPR